MSSSTGEQRLSRWDQIGHRERPALVGLEFLDWQADVMEHPKRFQVVCAGRRSGKTDLAMKYALVGTLRLRPGLEGWIIYPNYRWAKNDVWNQLLALLAKPNDWLLDGEPNANELTIPLIEGHRLCLKGSEDPRTLRGAPLGLAVFDEHAFNRNHQEVWERVVQPALSDKLGRAAFFSTFNGIEDFYKLWESATSNPEWSEDWQGWLIPTWKAGTVPAQELRRLSRTMAPADFEQEYLCVPNRTEGIACREFVNRRSPGGNVVSRESWERVRGAYSTIAGVDWARSSGKTGRLLVGVGSTGRLVVFAETLLPGGAPKRAAAVFSEMDQAHGAWDREHGRSTVEYNVMGRDAFSEESNGLSVANQLPSWCPTVMCPARLDDAVDRINDLCMDAPSGEPQEGEADDAHWPMLCVVEGTCPNLVGQMRTVTRQQLESKSQGTKDLVDALRMIVMMQAMGPRAIMMNPSRVRSFDDPDPTTLYDRFGEPVRA